MERLCQIQKHTTLLTNSYSVRIYILTKPNPMVSRCKIRIFTDGSVTDMGMEVSILYSEIKSAIYYRWNYFKSSSYQTEYIATFQCDNQAALEALTSKIIRSKVDVEETNEQRLRTII